jgi:hypothetical protein
MGRFVAYNCFPYRIDKKKKEIPLPMVPIIPMVPMVPMVPMGERIPPSLLTT